MCVEPPSMLIKPHKKNITSSIVRLTRPQNAHKPKKKKNKEAECCNILSHDPCVSFFFFLPTGELYLLNS